jgi:hypothetical protein
MPVMMTIGAALADAMPKHTNMVVVIKRRFMQCPNYKS